MSSQPGPKKAKTRTELTYKCGHKGEQVKPNGPSPVTRELGYFPATLNPSLIQKCQQLDISDTSRPDDPKRIIAPPAFMTKYQEDSKRAALKKDADLDRRQISARKRSQKAQMMPPNLTEAQQRTWHLKAAMREEDAQYYARKSQDRTRDIKQRLEFGYERFGYRILSGYTVEPLRENGLRSETLNSHAAAFWPALVPKASRLRTSWGKAQLETIGTKLFSLDEPYVEGNRDFLGFLRLDTDRVWTTPEECQYYYETLVAEGSIACAPHFIVGLRPPDGRFIRPHAIWILPYGSAVWNAPGHKQWRRGPVDLFKSVYYGLCNAALEGGADPDAPATSQQVKNPLSPEWLTLCLQDSHFPDLVEHSEYLDMKCSREKLVRRSVGIQSALGITGSNAVFNSLQETAYGALRDWHFNGDELYHDAMKSGRRGALGDRLHISLAERIRELDLTGLKISDQALELLIAKISDYAVDTWDPKKLARKSKASGTLMHVVEGMKTVKERRQAAAAYASSCKAATSLNALVKAVRRLNADGNQISKSSVARISGVALTTVKNRWKELESFLALSTEDQAFRSIDKKNESRPAYTFETSTGGETSEEFQTGT
ncbi:hypothetical protein [Phyllobacterium sp. SB3]|uniref:hypothetical protein n=1 Tax=Phyllobacterium sp. SB3 TaxID=3156073 RepID=UPI0032AFB3F9